MPTPAHPETTPAGKRRIRVLIVDDSALVRSLLTDILRADPGIEVVGSASDAHVAREKIKQLNPDVLTLDVEMPKMDGITFLKNLMRLRPMPVVMVSSLTERGADVTLDALAIGAVDYLSKPKIDLAATLKDYSEELIEKIKTASRASVRALDPCRAATIAVRPKFNTDAVLPKVPGSKQLRTTDRIIAIGASTGGTEAIKEVLTKLPPDTPGVVIAQHIPKAFSTPFAKRMNDCCQMTVYEAEDGQQVLAGHVYIAPGDRHLMVVRDGAKRVYLVNGDRIYEARQGDDLDGGYRVESIGPDQVVLLYVPMSKKEALPIGARAERPNAIRKIAARRKTMQFLPVSRI